MLTTSAKGTRTRRSYRSTFASLGLREDHIFVITEPQFESPSWILYCKGLVHCNDRSLWLWMDNQVTHTSWIDTQPEMPFESNEKTTTRQILGSTVRWPFRAPLNLWMPLFFVYTAYNLQIMESVLLTSAVAKRRPCVFCQHLMAWTWLYQASSEVSCFLYT